MHFASDEEVQSYRKEYALKRAEFQKTDIHKKLVEHGWEESPGTTVFAYEKIVGNKRYCIGSVRDGLRGHWNTEDD